MTWTNCGSKEVIKMFDRDRKEIEKERFNSNICDICGKKLSETNIKYKKRYCAECGQKKLQEGWGDE